MNLLSRRALSALAVLCVLTACGGDDEPAPVEEAAALSLSPTEQSVATGGAAIALAATGGSGSYAWALSPASGAGSLSATSGASVQYTPPASTTGPVVATVTVTSGSERAVAVLRVEPRTVQGKVRTPYGAPVAGLTVALMQEGGSFRSMVSDAEGRFSFSGVPATYDLAVVELAKNATTLYLGLTRSDPVLTPYGGSGPTTMPSSATVAGTVSGMAPAPLTPTTQTTSLSFAAANPFFASFPSAAANATTGAYSLPEISWQGSATTTGTLHALQFQRDAAGLPIAFPGYAKLEGITLTAGDSVTGKNLTLAPVASSAFSATFQAPAGTSVTSRTVMLKYAANAVVQIYSGGTGNSLAFSTPSVPGASLLVIANASGPNGSVSQLRSSVPLDASGYAIPVLQAAARTAPVSGATNVGPGTEFSWSAVPNAVHLVGISSSTSGQPSLYVATAASRFTLPNLSALGVSLPKAVAYNWTLNSVVVPAASVDTLATEGGYMRLVYLPVSAPNVESALLNSGSSGFTTAP